MARKPGNVGVGGRTVAETVEESTEVILRQEGDEDPHPASPGGEEGGLTARRFDVSRAVGSGILRLS